MTESQELYNDIAGLLEEKGLKLVRLREDAMRIIDTTHDCVELISSLVERS